MLYSHQTHQLWCHFKRVISNSKSHVRPLRPRITSLNVFIVYLLSYRIEIHRLTPTTKNGDLRNVLFVVWLTTRCCGHLYDSFWKSRPLTGI